MIIVGTWDGQSVMLEVARVGDAVFLVATAARGEPVSVRLAPRASVELAVELASCAAVSSNHHGATHAALRALLQPDQYQGAGDGSPQGSPPDLGRAALATTRPQDAPASQRAPRTGGDGSSAQQVSEPPPSACSHDDAEGSLLVSDLQLLSWWCRRCGAHAVHPSLSPETIPERTWQMPSDARVK